MKLKLTALTKEELESIHQASLNVLENVGIAIHAREALDIFKEAGADVDYKKELVKIPPHVVKERLREVPRKVTLHARNPKFSMQLEPGKVYFGTGGYGNFVQDLETGKRREATRKDAEDHCRVYDALDNLRYSQNCTAPVDVPAEVWHQYVWAIMLKNTSKHFNITAYGPDGVSDAIRMGSAVVGSKEKLEKNPIFSFLFCISSPLNLENVHVRGTLEAARQGFPIVVESGCMSAASAPATLAGTLVLSNAELLGTITMLQLANPGTPIIYQNWARLFDVRAINVSFGCPEFALLRPCVGEMARYYGLPSHSGGLSSDSKLSDMQAGYETLAALTSALSGCNLILEASALDSGNIVDIAKLVIGNEVAGMIYRILRGFEINDETLALDVIKEVGPQGNFLKTKHTLKHWKTEQWPYMITERRVWSEWNRDGAKTVWQRAREKAREILKTHQPEPLPRGVPEELDKIVKAAETRHLKIAS